VDMRQIGARQEAGKVGGIGTCGRELCCSTWLTEFSSVSTAAARYQNLAINQDKLSGQCGRLKCCLNYELDTYMEAVKQLPKAAKRIETEEGLAVLLKTDILRLRMYYRVLDRDDAETYALEPERVRELLALNKRGEKAPALSGLAIEEEEVEETVEFVEEAHVSLRTLERSDRKRRGKRSGGGRRGGGKPSAEGQGADAPAKGRRSRGGKGRSGGQGPRPEGKAPGGEGRNRGPGREGGDGKPKRSRKRGGKGRSGGGGQGPKTDGA
jgi:hypothetical protein